MSILPALKSAILRCTGETVQEVFASTKQIAREMSDLANEVATDIAKSQDWRVLTKTATVTGTGAEAYDMPSDYDRMLLSAEVDDATNWFWGYQPFESVNDWLRYKSGTYSIISPGGWILLGGQINFYPAPNGTAQYPYVSNQFGRDESDTPISEFTADTDTFLLGNRLLTLGLIWRWKDMKGIEYAEDMVTYEAALAQAQSRDKGARLLRTSSNRLTGARVAYSGRPLG